MKILWSFIAIAATTVASATAQLHYVGQRISDYLKDVPAEVGVAVATDRDETVFIGNDMRYPLMSVFKFHVALAVLDKMDRQDISPDTLLRIESSQLAPDTYSPLRDRYPDRDISIPLAELLRYMISMSDNNACDILIDFAGGIRSVDRYIRSLGITDFRLSVDERCMHRDIRDCYRNNSTPAETVRLLQKAYEQRLFRPAYHDLLWEAMRATSTGADKLKGRLPAEAAVAHKTGSSDRTASGIKIGDNDAGIVFLPDGRRYCIAVFVADSHLSDSENAAIIADISRMVYDAVTDEEDEELRVAFLTDLHVTPGNDNDKMIDHVVDEINAEDYDLVIIGGDMTNMGSDEELANIHRKLSRLDAPQLVVAGNHETTWSESACTRFGELWGHDSRTFADAGRYRFVGFQAGPFMKMADGTVRREDLHWADSVMSATPHSRRIIAVCHYPLSNDITNRREVTSMLRSHDVAAALCGHYPRPSLNNYDSIPGIIGRSLMLQVDGRPTYGYTVLRFSGDSVRMEEKLVGRQPAELHTIALGYSSDIAALPCDEPAAECDVGVFEAECVVEDEASIYTGVAVHGDTIFYGNSSGQIRAFDTRSRRMLWQRDFEAAIYSTPVYHDGRLIVATVGDGLLALDAADGTTLWCNRSLERMIGDGVIAEGSLYIGIDGAMLRIAPEDGRIIWRFDYGQGQPQGRPAVDGGRGVFGAWDCHLYCIDTETGTMLWRWNNGSENRLFSPGHIVPRISHGRVMIVAPDRHMTFMDLATGRQLWRIKSRKVRETTGISDDGEMFYAKTMDGEMIAVPVDADTYTEAWTADAGWGYDHNPCPILTRDGVAYMANRTGMIAAVDESDGRLLGAAKIASAAANDFTADDNGGIWVSFIDGRIFRIGLKTAGK